ncbi:MAG: cysteine--tRNA ligase [Patescibacteria group bacterium]|jgi:cysteinyl-tRNA synthetase
MAIKLHNSLTKQTEPLKPVRKGAVTVYNCGPTVYDYVHIGNLRSFLLADLLRRHLEARGLEVKQVMNITDVGHMLADADVGEDKMEAAASKVGKTPQEVAAFYTEAFFRDIDRLGVRRAHVYPKASEHIPEMIAVIEKLLANGLAYKVEENGGTSIYYDVAAFPKYGQLSGNSIEGLNPGARVEVRSEKKHPADFALWIHNPQHLLQWDAPWSRGYPGWHIECTAMSMKYLGESIDIHTGGEDNKFPHHECEIAQAEGATGREFVRVWLHVTHLMVDGEKMSKSKGNFYTLDDLIAKGYSPREVRYLLMSTHYRQPLNFTLQGLESARGALDRLDSFVDILAAYSTELAGRTAGAAGKASKEFLAALDEDLNVAGALAVVFDLVREANEALAAGKLTLKEKEAAVKFMKTVGEVLGFAFGRNVTEAELPASVKLLIDRRDEARREKRFAESDRLRDEIKAAGFQVEDTPAGRRIRRV